MAIIKKHSDTSIDTAVILKKGNFNIPSVILFLKKKNGGFDFITKPPLGTFLVLWS